MGRKYLKKFAAFFLVLAITVVVVAVLSAASRVSPETAVDRYMQQMHSQEAEPEGLSATVEDRPGTSLLVSMAGFAAILVVPLAGLLMFARAKRAGQDSRSGRQSYRPRKDMSLQRALGSKHRV